MAFASNPGERGEALRSYVKSLQDDTGADRQKDSNVIAGITPGTSLESEPGQLAAEHADRKRRMDAMRPSNQPKNTG